MTQELKTEVLQQLEFLIQKYSRQVAVRSLFVISDIQEIINKIVNKKEETLLEDVQNLYIQKYWKIPMRYKNDITRLSSKL